MLTGPPTLMIADLFQVLLLSSQVQPYPGNAESNGRFHCQAQKHLRSFLKDVLGQLKTTIIYNDNQGAGQLTRNPVFHKRTKHVDIRHHFIRELVEEGTISVNYIQRPRSQQTH